MKVLELFSGTHSIGKVYKKLNYEVVSLDRDLGDTHDDYTSANVGLSWLVSFGDYEGGLTELSFEEEGEEIIQFPLDSFHSPVCFNGSQI